VGVVVGVVEVGLIGVGAGVGVVVGLGVVGVPGVGVVGVVVGIL
jgi:hypothetical protein